MQYYKVVKRTEQTFTDSDVFRSTVSRMSYLVQKNGGRYFAKVKRIDILFLFIIFSHNQWFVETFLNDSFAVFNLFKHLFHKFRNGIFTSICLDWLTVSLSVATYNLVSIATVFMGLIGFGV